MANSFGVVGLLYLKMLIFRFITTHLETLRMHPNCPILSLFSEVHAPTPIPSRNVNQHPYRPTYDV